MSPVVAVALVSAALIVLIGVVDVTLEALANRSSRRRVRAAVERKVGAP